jgi:hypothetical protein
MARRVLSHLRRMPDELHISDGNGVKAKLLKDGVLQVECEDKACGCVFWVRSNNSINVCPSCSRTRIKKTWTRPQVAFIPQTYEDE